MTKLLREALEQVEKLPDAEQDAAAAALMDYLSHRRDTRLTDAQIAEVRRRMADPARVTVSAENAAERLRKLTANAGA